MYLIVYGQEYMFDVMWLETGESFTIQTLFYLFTSSKFYIYLYKSSLLYVMLKNCPTQSLISWMRTRCRVMWEILSNGYESDGGQWRWNHISERLCGFRGRPELHYCSLAQPSLTPAAHITKTAHYPLSPRGAAETRSVLQEPWSALPG